MTENTTQEPPNGKTLVETLRDSMMVILTLVFVLLYAAAFTGKLDPLKDNTMLIHLEPIIFIVLGYYLGRLPSRRSERTLNAEITRQTQKADAAQYAREKALIECEKLEEKIKNARTALKTATGEIESKKAVLGILDS